MYSEENFKVEDSYIPNILQQFSDILYFIQFFEPLMSKSNDQLLKDHIDKEFDKNDFTRNGVLPCNNIHIYVNEIFQMGGINRQVTRDEAYKAWKKVEPNATAVTKQGLYHTVKEIYWNDPRAQGTTVKTETVTKKTWTPASKQKVQTFMPQPTPNPPTHYYSPQVGQYYAGQQAPIQCVQTIEESKRKKRGIGFEINFLGFDFGTGFNRGTKTKTEKHTRWFK